MVGHRPLEPAMMVRIHPPQQIQIAKEAIFCLHWVYRSACPEPVDGVELIYEVSG